RVLFRSGFRQAERVLLKELGLSYKTGPLCTNRNHLNLSDDLLSKEPKRRSPREGGHTPGHSLVAAYRAVVTHDHSGACRFDGKGHRLLWRVATSCVPKFSTANAVFFGRVNTG